MIVALAALMLQAAAPPTAPRPAPETYPASARPLATLPSLFSDDDYPIEAIRKRESGTVAFRLKIGTDGVGTSCTVISSSRSDILDSATCRILMERARFSPARDRQGRPTTDSAVGRITWRLPEPELRPLEPSLEIVSISATPGGDVACSTVSNGQPEDKTCPGGASEIVEWARLEDKIVEQTIVTIVTPDGEPALVDNAVHGTQIAAIDSVLKIGSDGAVLECRVTRREIDPNFDGNVGTGVCAAAAPGTRLFEPASGAPTSPSRTVDIKFRAYYRLLTPSNLPIT